MVEYIISFGLGIILTSGYFYIEIKKLNKQKEQEKIEKEKYIEELKQANIDKGIKYEFQIGRYFKGLGYKIYMKGINEGKKDMGIDIIAYKDKEALLIQCKNSIYPIKQDIIRKFIGDCHMYEKEKNKYLNNKIVKRIIVSNSNMDKGCELYFKQHKVECNFLQIKEN
ncbi:restriction endonuclease [Campylobacter hyointestinalis]|uniref:restriction endonuclease n=1 Tax=Campylobacter hyointestinalis TaxID=198 RepID=UPI0025553586|nr:restriction endonuclease [Campylobacter hyointestinalis]MDL2346940.1 restriction endonuclease [Campylobacter hyointestinalis]MDL2348448.1 restriction endonuclease [Campylobacter hyointestinalis]MDL2350427.1 restriction endonuclease [Campylobacter hyointestinalis]MDM1026024.1 restriction endonuclease [Campylobacter hyointestinalis]MDM1027199.1 restriction endonuclease [Campylobacter hyointestinalis]